MTNDQPPAEELDQVMTLLYSVNSVPMDHADYIAQWTREQWSTAIAVRNAITAASPQVPGMADYLFPTKHVPEWLRETLNQTWFRHPGTRPSPSWLTSIDHRIDWFALAEAHPELILDNPHTQLITPNMMRHAVTLARTRGAQVITRVDLGPGRETGTIACALDALYVTAEHDPVLVVDITEIFGGTIPNPTSGSRSVPALNTATDPHAVYYGWEWSSMSWPDNANVPSYGYAS